MSDSPFIDPSGKNYIFIIHGIRTRATYLPQLQNDLLGALPGIETGAYYYGGFSLPKFLLRTHFAEEHIARIAQHLAELTSDGYTITVIAHSFGTYLLYEALKRNPKIRVDNIIFCGSILGHYAPLDLMKGQQIGGTIFNYCGRCDLVPPLAELSSRVFSATGTEGLFNRITRNSFHNIGHSGFLKPEFWRSHWIPLIRNNQFESGASELPWHLKLLLNLSTHRLQTLVLLLLAGTALLYLMDTLVNLRAPWACYVRSCYIESALTVKDFNNSIRSKENYHYFDEAFTAYNLNHDRSNSSYPLSPQPTAHDPEVLDVLDKNHKVEKNTDKTGRWYPLIVKNRLAAFIAQYKYTDYDAVPGGVAFTAPMLTKDVNIEIRMPPDVLIQDLFGNSFEGLFIVRRSAPGSDTWNAVARSPDCIFGSNDRIFCENIWLRPDERLVYCFSVINWRLDGQTLAPDLTECERYQRERREDQQRLSSRAR